MVNLNLWKGEDNMNNKELIVNFLNTQLEINQEEIHRLSIPREKDDYCKNLQSLVKKINENLENLSLLEIDLLENNFEEITPQDIKFLNFYKLTLQSKFVTLGSNDIAFLRKIIKKIETLVENYFEENKIALKPYEDKLKRISSLLEKVNNEEITSNEIDEIFELVKDMELNESIRLVRATYNYGVENLEKSKKLYHK